MAQALKLENADNDIVHQPTELLKHLDGIRPDDEKFHYLRTLFLDPADVDTYIQNLRANLDLTPRQLSQFLSLLECFKAHLDMYLTLSRKDIEQLDARQRENTRLMDEKIADPESQRELFAIRMEISLRIAQIEKPQGPYGKSLREVACARPLKDVPESEYFHFIQGLSLTPEQKKKLEQIIAGYDEALANAKEADPDIEPPSKERIAANLIAWGKKDIEEIAKIQGRPTLIIEPANQSLEETMAALNKHRHFPDQSEAYIATDYEWSGRRIKVGASVIDMEPHLKLVPGQEPNKQDCEEQLRICEQFFRAHGMRLIYDHEFGMAMQQSLRLYEAAKKRGEKNPEKYILDYGATRTMFNQEQHHSIKFVGRGRFDETFKKIHFWWDKPNSRGIANLRGRGAREIIR